MGRPKSGLGDGRVRLLDACWDLLVESPESGEKVTVAAVCRRAGCTPPTLYHHFADLPSLRRAAGERAFGEWAQQVEERIAGSRDPAHRLRRRGAAYVGWGVSHPQAYRALFLSPAAGSFGDPAPGGPGEGFGQLLADLAALVDGSPDDPALLPLGVAFWSAVHGLTALAVVNPDLPQQMRVAAFDWLADALIASARRPGA